MVKIRERPELFTNFYIKKAQKVTKKGIHKKTRARPFMETDEELKDLKICYICAKIETS